VSSKKKRKRAQQAPSGSGPGASPAPRRRWHWIAGGVLLLVLMVAGVADLLLAPAISPPPGEKVDAPVDAKFLDGLRAVSRDSLTRSLPAPPALKALHGPPLGGSPPGVLYVGGDFCPYCAAIRWPLVLALMRFGDFKNLHFMRSSHTDVFADSVTFSFHGSSYTSQVLDFQAVEVRDRAGNKLETLGGRARQIFGRFNDSPYTNSPGAIPFAYLNGAYAAYGSPFSPKLLSNLDWEQVLRALREHPDGDLARAILGAANLYTAAMCRLTDGKPADTCNAAGVQSAAGSLPAPVG